MDEFSEKLISISTFSTEAGKEIEQFVDTGDIKLTSSIALKLQDIQRNLQEINEQIQHLSNPNKFKILLEQLSSSLKKQHEQITKEFTRR